MALATKCDPSMACQLATRTRKKLFEGTCTLLSPDMLAGSGEVGDQWVTMQMPKKNFTYSAARGRNDGDDDGT